MMTDDASPRRGIRLLRRALVAVVAVVVSMSLTGCAAQRRALGVAGDDTAYDSIDDADLMVGVVGSETTSSRDARIMDEMSRNGVRASYANSSRTADPHAASLAAVRDYANRKVSAIVIMGMGFDEDRSGWSSVLEYARSSGVPVAVVDADSVPRDASLIAARLTVVADSGSDLAQTVTDVANGRSSGGRIAVTAGK